MVRFQNILHQITGRKKKSNQICRHTFIRQDANHYTHIEGNILLSGYVTLSVLLPESSLPLQRTLESAQGVNGGNEGTDCNINFLPLFKPPEELDPIRSKWLCGGETLFWIGEFAFTDLMGVEASFNTSGVSSSRMSKSFPSDSSSKLALGVIGELPRQRREPPDNWRIPHLLESWYGGRSIHSFSVDEECVGAFFWESFDSECARLLRGFLEDLVNFAEECLDFAPCLPWLDKWKKANQHKGKDVKIIKYSEYNFLFYTT